MNKAPKDVQEAREALGLATMDEVEEEQLAETKKALFVKPNIPPGPGCGCLLIVLLFAGLLAWVYIDDLVGSVSSGIITIPRRYGKAIVSSLENDSISFWLGWVGTAIKGAFVLLVIFVFLWAIVNRDRGHSSQQDKE